MSDSNEERQTFQECRDAEFSHLSNEELCDIFNEEWPRVQKRDKDEDPEVLSWRRGHILRVGAVMLELQSRCASPQEWDNFLREQVPDRNTRDRIEMAMEVAEEMAMELGTVEPMPPPQ